MKADWVFRDNVYDESGAQTGALGSYMNLGTTLAPGVGNAFGRILYDSHNHIKSGISTLGGDFRPFGSQGRAEGGQATILATRGHISIRPSAWALGANLVVGFRIGVFEQDAGTGLILVDPTYSMFTSGANISLAASAWANSRQWVWERRFYTTFSDNAQVYNMNVRIKCRRRLKPNECWALFAEANNQAGTIGSVTSTVTTWLKSLVSDEG